MKSIIQDRTKRLKAFFMKNYVRMVVGLCITVPVMTIRTFSVHAASDFDPVYYAASYPDVAAKVGTESETLWNHYLAYGMAEGRCPYAGS